MAQRTQSDPSTGPSDPDLQATVAAIRQDPEMARLLRPNGWPDWREWRLAWIAAGMDPERFGHLKPREAVEEINARCEHLRWDLAGRQQAAELTAALNRHRMPHPKAKGPARATPKGDTVRRVIAELWPDGVPSQSDLPNQKLCDAVQKRLAADRIPFTVSDKTILRAAGPR